MAMNAEQMINTVRGAYAPEYSPYTNRASDEARAWTRAAKTVPIDDIVSLCQGDTMYPPVRLDRGVDRAVEAIAERVAWYAAAFGDSAVYSLRCWIRYCFYIKNAHLVAKASGAME
mgnify:CR=1 FL=1